MDFLGAANFNAYPAASAHVWTNTISPRPALSTDSIPVRSITSLRAAGNISELKISFAVGHYMSNAQTPSVSWIFRFHASNV